MEKQQDDAYKEAIEEYRAASRARIAKNSEINSNNIFGVLPRRQISNYFVQFRKVLQFLSITFSMYSIYTLQTIHILCLSPNFFFCCVFFFFFFILPPFTCLFQIANHPLLVRRIYRDEDVVRFAKKLHPMGVFGFDCTLDRVIEELKSYNDFSVHRVNSFLSYRYLFLFFKC